MPGFISHTVMANDIYNKINKRSVNRDYLVTYSLGGDLCKYSKCRYDSHHKKQDVFIDNMVKYIKDNNLSNNKAIIGVLYGHIAHHIMDNTIHPLVVKIDRECLNNRHNHAHIEEYYDRYLVDKIYHTNVKEYLKKNILNTTSNKEIDTMLDHVYLETYHTKNISKYYKYNLFLYRNLKRIYILFKENFIYKISGLNRFMNNNKNIKIDNCDRCINYKDHNKKETCNNLMECYKISIDRTIKYIDKVNKELKI